MGKFSALTRTPRPSVLSPRPSLSRRRPAPPELGREQLAGVPSSAENSPSALLQKQLSSSFQVPTRFPAPWLLFSTATPACTSPRHAHAFHACAVLICPTRITNVFCWRVTGVTELGLSFSRSRGRNSLWLVLGRALPAQPGDVFWEKPSCGFQGFWPPLLVPRVPER